MPDNFTIFASAEPDEAMTEEEEVVLDAVVVAEQSPTKEGHEMLPKRPRDELVSMPAMLQPVTLSQLIDVHHRSPEQPASNFNPTRNSCAAHALNYMYMKLRIVPWY